MVCGFWVATEWQRKILRGFYTFLEMLDFIGYFAKVFYIYILIITQHFL